MSPPFWESLKKLGAVALWGLLASIAVGSVPISSPFLALLLVFGLVFLWPGAMLLHLFRVGLESWLARLALSFALSFGLWSLPAGVLMALHADAIVETMVWLILGVTLCLSVLCFFHRQPSQSKDIRECEGNRQPATISRVPWLLYCMGVGACLALALIVFVKNASPYWPSDRSTYQDYILYFLEDQSLYTKILAGRVEIQSWIILQALLVRLSQANLLDVYVHLLPSVLIVLAFVSFFVFAEELFDDQIMGMLAVIVQSLYIFSDINGPSEYASGFFRRLIEDKYLVVFILLPLAGWLTLRYLKSVDKPSLVGLLITLVGMTFVHPLGLVFYGVSLVPFMLLNTLVCPPRKYVRLVPIFVTLAFLTLIMMLMWRTQMSIVSNANVAAFSLRQALANPWIASITLVLDEGSELYVLSPRLVLRPLIVVAMALFPILVINLRRSNAARFLFVTTMSVFLLGWTPLGTSLLAKLISIFVLYRVVWLLPISLIVAFFLGSTAKYGPYFLETAQKLLGRFFSRSSRGVLSGDCLKCASSRWAWWWPLLIIVIGAFMLRAEIAYGLGKLGQDKEHSVAAEEMEVFAYLRESASPGSTILTSSTLLDDELPAFVGHSQGVTLRDWDPACSDWVGRQKPTRDFYTTGFVTSKHTETLRDCHIQYIVIENGTELATQLDSLNGMFGRRFSNREYSVYYWHPDKSTEVDLRVIQGNTYLLQNRLEEAEELYLQAAGTDPNSPLVALGRGAIAEMRLDLKQAFVHYKSAAALLPQTMWLQSKLAAVLGVSPEQIPGYLALGESYRLGAAADWGVSDWPVYCFMDHVGDAEFSVQTAKQIRLSAFAIDKHIQGVLFQHPPSQIRYTLTLPATGSLKFSVALAPEVWLLDKGDGVQFEVDLDTSEQMRDPRRYQLYTAYVDPKNTRGQRRWSSQVIDMSPWAGQTVTISFATGCGPKDDCEYDWAGWGEPRIVQPIAYDFLTELPQADLGGAGEQQVRQDTLTIDYESRPILFQHPSNRVTYHLTMPGSATLYFGLGIDPAVWSADKGDGVEYNVYVRRPEEPYVLHWVLSRYLNPRDNAEDRHWLDQSVDLSDYSGQPVQIIFEALPGSVGNADFDWGGWSMPVLVSSE